MHSLHEALVNPFQHYIGDPYPRVYRLSLVQRAMHCKDRAFHEGNIGGIAMVAAETLNKMPRTSPKQADADPQLSAYKKFLRIAQGFCPTNESVGRCQRAFRAFKLAVPLDVLNKNPDFEEFAQKNRLDRQLILYDHKIEVGEDWQLQILCQGKMQPWENVKHIVLAGPPALKMPLPELYNPRQIYREDGLCNRNYYNWTTLEPCQQEKNPPPWGNRYILKLCCLCTGNLRFLGDHNWVELGTPEGKIYAPGLYREDNNLWTGCSLKRGAIQNPDISRSWDEKIHSVSFEISQDDFNRIKQQVEKDHQSNPRFHIVHQNCAKYALGLARLAGIDCQIKESVVDHFVHKKIRAAAINIRDTLPKPLQGLAETAWRVDRYFCSVALNIVQTMLGAAKVSPSFSAEEREDIQPHIASVTDVFKSSKLEGQSAYTIAFTLSQKVEAARIEEAKRRGVDPKELRYWIPEQYRLAQHR